MLSFLLLLRLFDCFLRRTSYLAVIGPLQRIRIPVRFDAFLEVLAYSVWSRQGDVATRAMVLGGASCRETAFLRRERRIMQAWRLDATVLGHHTLSTCEYLLLSG